MNDKSLHLALPVVSLMVMMAPVRVAQEQKPTPSPQGNGYTVVPPPKGAVIPSAPESSTTVQGGDKSYAYSNGVFYEP
ncbi:MAG: DUF6515 family protein, partial [Chthoniobacterales bacterium]